jgi:hypothetical protein
MIFSGDRGKSLVGQRRSDIVGMENAKALFRRLLLDRGDCLVERFLCRYGFLKWLHFSLLRN